MNIRCKHILTIIFVLAMPYSDAVAGTPFRFLKKVGTFIDSASVSGVDRSYIDAPKKPWQIILKGNVNQSDLKMNVEGQMGGVLDYTAEPRLKTEPASYVGFWAGYRGYGLGYSVNVAGDKGKYFTIGAMGGAYGINVRFHDFENNNPNYKMKLSYMGEQEEFEDDSWVLEDPIKVHTVIADAYYLFNGKHYSYAAAYDQSVIQKRSAGSLMAGAMYYYGNIDYATSRNASLIEMMKGLGRVKLWQGSVGVGYAYNWVPARGLLINAMLMPMVTFVNKIKVYAYSTNYYDILDEYLYSDEGLPDDESLISHRFIIDGVARKTFDSGVIVNFDARLSLTYNFGDYFINAYGQFYNFRYSHNENKGHLNDWFINAAFGLRL